MLLVRTMTVVLQSAGRGAFSSALLLRVSFVLGDGSFELFSDWMLSSSSTVYLAWLPASFALGLSCISRSSAVVIRVPISVPSAGCQYCTMYWIRHRLALRECCSFTSRLLHVLPVSLCR